MSQQWIANTAYGLGTYVESTTYNGYKYEATTGGTSHATTEPTWPTILGNTVADGTVTWTCRAHSDFSKILLSSKYTGLYDEIRDLIRDVARMQNTDTIVANVPTGAVRQNPTTNRFEKWSGSAWVVLDLSGQAVGNATNATNATNADTVDSYHASQLAKLAVANDFTQDQTIRKSYPLLQFQETAFGEYMGLQFGDWSANTFGYFLYDHGSDRFSMGDTGGAKAAWERTTGKMILGTVPLARMGTVVASGSQAVSANTAYGITISGSNGTSHVFYQYSAYLSSSPTSDLISYGARVQGDETVAATVHFTISTRADIGRMVDIINGYAASKTIEYKVYKLTEA